MESVECLGGMDQLSRDGFLDESTIDLFRDYLREIAGSPARPSKRVLRWSEE